MCTVGGPPDVGDVETLTPVEYKCLDCGNAFKGIGRRPTCPSCRSKNVKPAK